MKSHIFKYAILCLLLGNLTQISAQDRLTELYYSGQFSQVIKEASSQISTGDSSAANYRIKTLAEIQLGQTARAISTLEEALEAHPADASFSRMLAGQYFEAGNYIKATSAYKILVSEDSTDISSWMKLAEISTFKQHYPQAIKALNQVLALDTMNLNSLMKMGEILDRFNNTGAIIFYKKAWTYYPENQKAGYAYANELIHVKKSVEAIPVCDSLLLRDPSNIKFLKLRGYAYYKGGDPTNAIINFNKASSLGDSTVFSFKYRGICQYLVSDFAGSVSSLRHAAVKDSTDAEIRFFLGSSLATTKEKKAAMYQLNRSLELMQPDPSVVGRIYAEQGNIQRLEMDYEEALEFYTLAWEADTTNPLYLYFQASILDNSMHRSKEALAVYEHYALELSNKVDENRTEQAISILTIVMDRIQSLKEELFFRDEN